MESTRGKEAAEAASEKTRDMISIVIPAYNEELTIEPTIRDFCSALDAREIDYEILVVNDSSTDDTVGVLEKLEQEFPRLRHLNNAGPNGYGSAVRYGLDHFRGDAVIISTADGADSSESVVEYFDTLQQGYDCVFGSRFTEGATVTDYPPFKLFLNRMGNRLISVLMRTRYNDFTNGFKCHRRWVIEQIQPLTCDGFNVTIEISMKAVRSGARYAVVPTDWADRLEGHSKFDVLAQVGGYLTTIMRCLMVKPGSRPQACEEI